MADATKIEWTATPLPTDADLDWLRSLNLKPMENPVVPGEWLLPGYTFNPWIGCTKFTDGGCKNCYAESLMDTRYGRVRWGRGNPRQRTSPQNWNKVKRWNKVSQQVFDRYGVKLRVFCGSLMDWADSEVDQSWRDDLFTLIESCESLNWLMLTKRLDVKPWEPYETGMARLWDILPQHWLAQDWPEHVWFGHSVACQRDADTILPELKHLADTVASNYGNLTIFISYEPATGPVDWTGFDFVSQVIIGGESGPGARPYQWQWGLDTWSWCQENGVKCYFKQTGQNAIRSVPYVAGIADSHQPVVVTGKGNHSHEWPTEMPREYL